MPGRSQAPAPPSPDIFLFQHPRPSYSSKLANSLSLKHFAIIPAPLPAEKKKKETEMASIRETLLETAKAYIEGFNSGTPEGVIAARTPDCTQTLRPGTLPPPLTGSRTNEEYKTFIVQGAQILRNIKLRLAEGEDIIVDDVARKIVMHLKSTGETDFGPYANEYMIVLKATEDGKQIKEIVEFTDSAYFLSLAAKMAPPA